MLKQPTTKISYEPFSHAELIYSLTERFQNQAKKYPNRLAIGSPSGELTYDELNRQANAVARAVLKLRPSGSKPVALLFHSDTSMIIALLGVLKAGGFCVPLDPSHPEVSNGRILDETQPDLLITNDEGTHTANKVVSTFTQLLNIDELLAESDEPLPDLDITPNSLAFVLFTSGTTGHPKGVMITHQQLLHLVMYHTNTRMVSAEDRLSSLTRCHHIGGIADVFRALLNGAALYPYDLRTQTIGDLINWLITERITILHCVPTIFRTLIHLLPGEETLPHLRLLHLGGEPVTKGDIELYKARFSNECILVNNFGSSETGPLGQYFVNKETEISENIVPILLAVEDKEIFLVNTSTIPNDNRVVGEIAVRSQFISPGYWSKSGHDNAKRFVEGNNTSRTFLTGDLGQLGPDGMLVYMGRKDHQVKIRGIRVDLTEIEANIRNLHACNDVAVLTQIEEEGLKLVAYLVPAQDLLPDASTLRSELLKMMPSHMIPSEFFFLESLPRTPTGKVDRLAIPSESHGRFLNHTTHIAPRNELEHELVQLWKELLDLSTVGIHNRFFDLGGNSLFVIKLSNRISRLWEIRLSMADIFAHPTVGELASHISNSHSIET